VISDAGPHPYFRTLIEAGGLDPATVVVGCVGSAGPLQREMSSLGVRSFALAARDRRAYPLAIIRLARMLRSWRAPVVQTHLVDGSLVGLAAARLARIPLAVFTAHHSHELPFHGRALILADRLCAGPLCDHVIAPSQQVADTLVRMAGIDPGKIAVVHHGFDLERLDPARIDRDAARRRLGIEGLVVFGAVGRIYALKNQLALVEAFAEALAGVVDARLAIVGPGDDAPLRERAAQLGIADRLLVWGSRADIPEVLAAVDVFVHAAIAESFGMVIVEAMAMELPTLSTPVGIAPEIIRTGMTGVLCRSAEPGAIADALRTMMELRPRWGVIGAAARKQVEGFTAQSMAARYTDLYARWLGSGV